MANNNDYRFSIVLNPGDPMHMTAINALKAQGRRKSQFIVNAVVYYIMNDKSQANPMIPDQEELRSICLEIISEMIPDLIQLPDTLFQEEDYTPDRTDQDFDLSAISETLNGFRKK